MISTWKLLPTDSDCTESIGLADVDGDGDLDIALGNFAYPGEPNRLYLNDGSGIFNDATARIPADSDQTSTVALADVDGDADPDLVIANHSP